MKDLLFIALVLQNSNMGAFKKTIGYAGTPGTILVGVKNEAFKFSKEISCEYIELTDAIDEIEGDEWFISDEFELKQILIEGLTTANEDIKAFKETDAGKMMKELSDSLSGGIQIEGDLESLLESQVDDSLPVINLSEDVQTTGDSTATTTTEASTKPANKPSTKPATSKKGGSKKGK